MAKIIRIFAGIAGIVCVCIAIILLSIGLPYDVADVGWLVLLAAVMLFLIAAVCGG